jgi:hypothetical protein
MAALARVLSRTTGLDIDVENLRPILIFCGAGLLVALLMIIFGINAPSADWLTLA